MNKVFISYRREDTGSFVDRLVDALEAQLPDHEIFRDIGGIKVSEDWVDRLRDEISTSQRVLVVIGAKWLKAGRNGRRRIDDPKDILRREIEWAHKKRVPVTPVLVDGAPMPAEGALPPDMKFLHRLQAQRIGEKSFEADVGALAQRLQELREKQKQETRDADAMLDEIDAAGPLEFTPGAVDIEDFGTTGNWTCEVRSKIANDPGFAADGRATLSFRIPPSGGTFKGTWKAAREFRIEGNWMIGAADPHDPHRVTSLRLQGVADGVDPFAWEIPIAERSGGGYRGVDVQGRHYACKVKRPAKARF